MSKTILLLAASPVDQAKLHLDVEAREIDEGLRRSVHRDQFQLEKKGAVQTDDLRRALLDNNNIKILHFCGHGTGSDGLVFEDQQGKAQLVSTEALASLFQLFAGQIECVVLNACYSEVQAQAIVQHVGYVIGMNKAIGDKAAIKFSIGFYDALGGGRSFEDAYKFGCNAIQSEGIPEHLTPVLKINTAWKYVLEEKSKNPPNISKDSSSTSAESLDSLSPMNKNELLDILERIIQAEFDQLLFKLNVPGNLMPGSDKPQTQRAIALLEWAESPKGCGLKKIKQALDE